MGVDHKSVRWFIGETNTVFELYYRFGIRMIFTSFLVQLSDNLPNSRFALHCPNAFTTPMNRIHIEAYPRHG
jgi:hypothetical protein